MTTINYSNEIDNTEKKKFPYKYSWNDKSRYFDFTKVDRSIYENQKFIIDEEIMNSENDNINNELLDEETMVDSEYINSESADQPKIKEDILEIKLLNKFSSTFIEIMDDIIDLFSKDLPLTEPSSYIFYIKKLYLIITKKGRTFYVGILFMMIAIVFSFIDITK